MQRRAKLFGLFLRTTFTRWGLLRSGDSLWIGPADQVASEYQNWTGGEALAVPLLEMNTPDTHSNVN